MYDDHYGLSGRPFQLTPDPRFWFESATHRKAMAYLGYGLSQGEGFIVVTGDIGAGKTTLVGHLMATIDRERLHAIKIVSTQIEADDLLRMVAVGLEIDPAGMVKAQLLDKIERALHAVARSGRRTLLIVDEAQALPVNSLEELRMLSNFQAGGHAILQIFLLGQPEFRERLYGSERLEQLRQRVIATHHLDPMGRDEIEPYMRHRLGVVGWTGRPAFTPDAFDALYAGSDGVPRRLNQLAGRVMLYGAIEQLDTIDGAAVATVIADMSGDAPIAPPAAPVASVDPAMEAEQAPVEMTAEPEPDNVPEAVTPDAEVAPEPTLLAIQPAPVVAPLPLGRLHLAPAAPMPVADIADTMDAEPFPHAARASDTPSMGEPADEGALIARIADLESRVEEQEAALRRVLTLLIDWIESDRRHPDIANLQAR